MLLGIKGQFTQIPFNLGMNIKQASSQYQYIFKQKDEGSKENHKIGDIVWVNTTFFGKKFGSISVSGQLPTYPSPNSTKVNWQQVKVNVGLGEG